MAGVEQWLKLWRGENRSIRTRVAQGLLRYHEELPLEVLLDLLDQVPDESTRSGVASTLSGRDDPELFSQVLNRLQSGDPRVREAASGILWNLRNPEAVPHLEALLTDPDNEVRRAASWVLKQFRRLGRIPPSPSLQPEDSSEGAPWLDPLCESLGERAYRGGVEALSEPERHVFLAYWAKGIIDNGGIPYFYEGATNMREVAEAYEAVGLPLLADACRRSMSVFLDGEPPYSEAALAKWTEEQDPSLIEYWDDLSEAVWDCSQAELEQALAQYVRSHPEAFDVQE